MFRLPIGATDIPVKVGGGLLVGRRWYEIDRSLGRMRSLDTPLHELLQIVDPVDEILDLSTLALDLATEGIDLVVQGLDVDAMGGEGGGVCLEIAVVVEGQYIGARRQKLL